MGAYVARWPKPRPPATAAGYRGAHAACVPLLRRLRRRGPVLREILLHARRHAVLSHLFQPDRVDAAVLVLVFDLVTALLDVDRHGALVAGLDAEEGAALPQGERVAQPTNAGGEVARGEFAGVEML